jgi:hypothetical protein
MFHNVEFNPNFPDHGQWVFFFFNYLDNYEEKSGNNGCGKRFDIN